MIVADTCSEGAGRYQLSVGGDILRQMCLCGLGTAVQAVRQSQLCLLALLRRCFLLQPCTLFLQLLVVFLKLSVGMSLIVDIDHESQEQKYECTKQPHLFHSRLPGILLGHRLNVLHDRGLLGGIEFLCECQCIAERVAHLHTDSCCRVSAACL